MLDGEGGTLVVDAQGAAAPDLREFDAEKLRRVVLDGIPAGARLTLDNKKLA